MTVYEREWDLKDTHPNTQNAAQNVDLFQNIFYINKFAFQP